MYKRAANIISDHYDIYYLLCNDIFDLQSDLGVYDIDMRSLSDCNVNKSIYVAMYYMYMLVHESMNCVNNKRRFTAIAASNIEFITSAMSARSIYELRKMNHYIFMIPSVSMSTSDIARECAALSI